MPISAEQTARAQSLKRAGEVAAAVGIGVQTLHYYERIGLLPKPQRSSSNNRFCSPQVVRRVQFIRKAQILGFTLEHTPQPIERMNLIRRLPAVNQRPILVRPSKNRTFKVRDVGVTGVA